MKEEIRDMLYEKTKAKTKKTIDIEEIRAQLCGIMRAKHRHVMEDEEVYMYPTYMHSDERDAYWVVVCVSKVIEWVQQQYETVVGSKRKTRELSSPSGTLMMRKSQSMRHLDPSTLIAHRMKTMTLEELVET